MKSQDIPIAVELVRFWSGNGPRSNYSHSLAAGISLYLSCAITAILIFPNFDILVNYVSDVGSPFHNLPVGAFVYNFGEFCCGVIMIPQFLYRYRQLQPAFKVFNVLSAIFGILGSLGFASLAIFYEGSTPIWAHGAASTTAIYGLGACMFFMFWVFVRKKILAKVWPKWWSLGIVYGEVVLVVGLMTLFSNYVTLFSGWDINHGFFRADIFWEWMLVAALFAWVVGSFLTTKPVRDPAE